MVKESVKELISGFKDGGIRLVTGVPDSWLGNVHEAVAEDPDFRYVLVGNEGVGFSICAGAWLGGMKSALVMESSGLRVACEYIARYCLGSNIPAILILSNRGDFGDREHWSTSHRIVAEPLLKALRIPYVLIRERDNLRKYVRWAITTADTAQYPAAILIGGDLVWQ